MGGWGWGGGEGGCSGTRGRMAEGDVCGRGVLGVEGEGGGRFVLDAKSETYQKVASAMKKFTAKYSRIDATGRMATLNSLLITAFPEQMWFVGFYMVAPGTQ